ncbi:MAG TPA: class I SAM-dependent methyltransferase [Kofleriaceae bacterium]|jgi:ubiquinone/menaquinone biosynthesis C-methylase UbiE
MRLDQRLTALAYHSAHLGFLINATIAQEAARLVSRTPRPTINRFELKELMRRRKELHARDLKNVAEKLYPRELLFDLPVRRYLKALPDLIRDAPNVMRRMKSGNYKDIPAVDKTQYPAYYRRNFHWQTDGYFSEHSAEVYELGVELLFRGLADVMRRQIIPPITRYIRARGGADGMRALDVACGTGRTLHQLRRTHPTLQLDGIDLSPAYADKARARLHDDNVRMHEGNAEHLPFPDATFDVVTSVYLFHELPRNARRNVIREMLRVAKPGGLVVIEDSAQLAESSSIASALRAFPSEFHEPFFEDYLADDIEGILRECGGSVEAVEPHLVAKVVIARRV